LRLTGLLLIWFCGALPALAEDRPAGAFDYYVLALSWSPSWCALEGDARHAAECRAGAGLGVTLHGLWPQAAAGWPSYCRTAERDPTRGETDAMADLMGSGGLAWHEWQKHGRCSGLSAAAYFAAMRRARAALQVPDTLLRITRQVRLSPREIEAAFLAANPGLTAGGIAVTCQAGRLSDILVCLDRGLEPLPCGPSVARDCPSAVLQVDPPR
jgi:ribonuclease T2